MKGTQQVHEFRRLVDGVFIGSCIALRDARGAVETKWPMHNALAPVAIERLQGAQPDDCSILRDTTIRK